MWCRRIISNANAARFTTKYSTAKYGMLMDSYTKININLVRIFSYVLPSVAIVCCAVVNRV